MPPVAKVNLYEAKTNLSRLVNRVEHGEVIVLARHGRPVATLQPYKQGDDAVKVQRSGFFKGRYNIPDDFDTVGQDEIVRMFEETAS